MCLFLIVFCWIYLNYKIFPGLLEYKLIKGNKKLPIQSNSHILVDVFLLNGEGAVLEDGDVFAFVGCADDFGFFSAEDAVLVELANV